jgi:hypothetical protein
MTSSSDVQGRRWRVGAALAKWGPAVASAVLSSALACGVASAIVLTGQPAQAETVYDSAYGFERTWNSALRMVRVDMGCKVTEKDDQTGYLMFEYHSGDSAKKGSPGTMQFIRPHEKDASVRLVIQLAQMPRYHEQVLLDTLVRKMHAEYGDPPQPTAPPPPAPVADAGARQEAGNP